MSRTLLFYSYDIETLGTHQDAPIIEAGLTAVYDNGTAIELDMHSVVLPFPAEMTPNRLETLRWHLQQGEAGSDLIQDSLAKRDHPQATNISGILHAFFRDARCYENPQAPWFMRGPSFDMPLTERALKHHEPDYPWKFYNVFCQRSIMAANPDLMSDTLTPHRAGPDSLNQAQELLRVFENLYGTTTREWPRRFVAPDPAVPRMSEASDDTPASVEPASE